MKATLTLFDRKNYIIAPGLSHAEKQITHALKPKEITYDSIEQVVCSHLNVSPEEVRSKSRKGRLPYARQLFYFLCRYLSDEIKYYSDEKAGEYYAQDRATVIAGYNKIVSYLAAEKKAKKEVLKMDIESLITRIRRGQ